MLENVPSIDDDRTAIVRASYNADSPMEQCDLDTLVTTFAYKHPRGILLPCFFSE